MKPWWRHGARENYRLALCGDGRLLAWAALAGLAAGLAVPGSITIYTIVSPDALYGLLATMIASIFASFYAACGAYLGLRWMLPQVIYTLSFYYIPGAIVKTIVYHDIVSAMSAAIDSLLLSAAGLYEERLIRGKSGLASFLVNEARESIILGVVLLAGAGFAAVHGHAKLAALITVLAGYLQFHEITRYFARSVWGWSGAPSWEKAAATGLTLFYASLAAAFLLI